MEDEMIQEQLQTHDISNRMWGKSNHSRACGLTAANKLLATHGLSITVFQQKTKSLNK